jgi:hypothetical protein
MAASAAIRMAAWDDERSAARMSGTVFRKRFIRFAWPRFDVKRKLAGRRRARYDAPTRQ